MNKKEFKYLQKLIQITSIGFAIAGFVFLFLVTPSKAQSDICHVLKSQLNSLSSSHANPGNTAKYRRYDAAVREQTVQLNKTIKIGRRKGCIGLGVLSLRTSQCKRIKHSLERMKVNLAKLKNLRAKNSPQQLGNSNRRQKILVSLRNNGCNERKRAAFDSQTAANTHNNPPVRKKRRRTLLEQIFGVRSYKDNGFRSNRYNEFSDGMPEYFRGTFRTLCVRKTDGYYFPISFSTTQNFFERDDQACRSMCPSTEVGLYFHKMPSQDSEDMISYDTQQPYASEDFAFRYRKKFDRKTSCRFSQPQLAELREVTVPGSSRRIAKSNMIGIPLKRIDSNLSPDDIENNSANVDMTKAKYYLIKKKHKDLPSSVVAEIPNPSNNKKIRVVGGVFFPVQ